MLLEVKYPLTGSLYVGPRDTILTAIEPFAQVVLIVVAIGFILKMISMIMKIFLRNDVSIDHLIWVFVVIVIIDNYRGVIVSFDNTTTALIGALMPMDEDKGGAFFAQYMDKENLPKPIDQKMPGPDPIAAPMSPDQLQQDGEQANTNKTDISLMDMLRMTAKGADGTGFVMSLMLVLTNTISMIVAGLAKLLIIIASVVLLLIILPLGLYALAFSYLPTFEDNIKGWLGIFLAIKFWFVVFVVIDLVVSGTTQGLSKIALDAQGAGSNAFSLTGVLISFILGTSYLLIPFLAGIIIPSQGSSLLTYVMGGAFTAVSMGGAALAKGVSMHSTLKNYFKN